MTTETQTPVVTNPALVQLSTIENEVLVSDMNYLFHYRRVKRPDDIFSDYFALNYKEEQQEQWSTCRGLLSSVFTVAKTEQVIQQIQQSLGGNIQSERHYRSETSVRSTFTLSGYQIDVPEEQDIDLVLFKLITNISAEVSVLTSSNLTFNVTNGFAGNHALSLNYGLLKTMVSRIGEEDKILPVNNIFILDKFTKRIIHDSRLSINIEDVTNVQRELNNQITLFRSLPAGQETVNSICEHLPKKFTKKFLGLYENLPENLRNLYYCSYIWSVLLDTERSISLEIKLRDLVWKKIELMIRHRNSNASAAA